MGKKRQRKSNQFQTPRIAEGTRIQISKRLEEFRQGNSEVYTFESNLTNTERAEVHLVCRKMGMVSKSSGRGNQRSVSVFKSGQKKDTAKKFNTRTTCLNFSEETKDVLRDLFTHYPPLDGETFEKQERPVSNRNTNGRLHDSSFCKPTMSKRDIGEKAEIISSKLKESTKFKKIAEQRSKLPIASFQDIITKTVESHQVVLISGETGCGKTTQVPQYLLDYMWGKRRNCKIVCTQPRRISAISVAERISSERGESVGESVGYKIRLESRGGKHSSIMFCTNGILLRLLIGMGAGVSTNKESNIESDKTKTCQITHIIIDEIHERDHFADFMLAVLRDQLPLWPHLRLVLMSATIDAQRFSQYFNGCPIIRIPGFTYPVKTFHLEDVLSILNSEDAEHLKVPSVSLESSTNPLSEEYRVAMDESISLACLDEEFEPLLELISTEVSPEIYNYQHSLTGATPLMVLSGKGRVGDVCMLLSFGADIFMRDNDGGTALDWAQRGSHEEVVGILKGHMEKHDLKLTEEQHLLEKYLLTVNPDRIDFVLIEKLLKRISLDSEDGAILVFLPGWEDISQSRERLLSSPFFSDSSRFLIMVLHSMIPSSEQKRVFKRPPPGVRKIILSTNIAETAVTIDDVIYVIDSGRMKEKSYDPYNNVSTLQSSWVSKASAKQREGRAGRCQPGICYHLFSRSRAASLPDYDVPEIKRMPIEEICLQVKLLDTNLNITDFIQKTLDPPVSETIRNAIIALQDLGALTDNQELTELGKRLGALPVHPLTSKMLLFAILMNCLDPALTLACASGYRDPFVLPISPGERKMAAAAKMEFSSLYGSYSDQLTIIAAFDCWKGAKANGQERDFCSRYYISPSIMNMLSAMRKQLETDLIQNGFLPENSSSCSLNARDPGILRAIIVAGMYPMVGRLLPQLKKRQKMVVETASGAKVRLHPHSSNFNSPINTCSSCPLLVYDEITRGDGGMYIKNCTLIGPYPLLILAIEMVVVPTDDNNDDNDEGSDSDTSDADEREIQDTSVKHGEKLMSSPDNAISVVVDRWLRFESTALDVAQIYCLRERLFSAILFKVKHPREMLPPALGASVYAIACMLSYNGMAGISDALMSVDSLTTMVGSSGIGSSKCSNQQQASIKGVNSPSSIEYLRSLIHMGASVPNERPAPSDSAAAYHSVKHLRKSKSAPKFRNSQGDRASTHKHGRSAWPNNRNSAGSADRTISEAPSGSGDAVRRSGSSKRHRDRESGVQ